MSGPTKAVKTKLFIGNLDPATQSSELSELFASFGTVLESSVIKDYGFIHYGTIEENKTVETQSSTLTFRLSTEETS